MARTSACAYVLLLSIRNVYVQACYQHRLAIAENTDGVR